LTRGSFISSQGFAFLNWVRRFPHLPPPDYRTARKVNNGIETEGRNPCRQGTSGNDMKGSAFISLWVLFLSGLGKASTFNIAASLMESTRESGYRIGSGAAWSLKFCRCQSGNLTAHCMEPLAYRDEAKLSCGSGFITVRVRQRCSRCPRGPTPPAPSARRTVLQHAQGQLPPATGRVFPAPAAGPPRSGLSTRL
jgi:hypothetical protein